ncbi:MAG: hypothetical protein H7Y89_07045 [Steroidobacteraceae bacterium]|nr:hypothetical protein [Steroidobacteraceae bacterium]
MKRMLVAILWLAVTAASHAGLAPPVIEITGPDGRTFREIPVTARDGAMRSYLEAERGARYEVRVHNPSGERLGLVIAVDGRNIINGKKSELARGEPMYVLDAWDTQSYAGWRANLDAINEFYFTDWSDSYAEAFGDRSARGVIAVAVYREVPPPPSVTQRYEEEDARASRSAPAAGASPRAADRAAEKSAGTGYGDRRVDRAVEVEFVAQSTADSRHFIKYEWRETLCRKKVLDCGEKNRFWNESVVGFALPPPRRR